VYELEYFLEVGYSDKCILFDAVNIFKRANDLKPFIPEICNKEIPKAISAERYKNLTC
jgi:hypothetical protein